MTGSKTTIVEGREMNINPILMRILTAAASIVMLAAAGIGSVHAASSLTYNPDGTVVGLSLPGISPAGYPNFENSIKLKVKKKGQKGFKLKVRKKGKEQYLNGLSESL